MSSEHIEQSVDAAYNLFKKGSITAELMAVIILREVKFGLLSEVGRIRLMNRAGVEVYSDLIQISYRGE